ncbi:MAG: hypothetical protein C4542_03125 [Dehalococcoidia bacterium]|nr:MAG: hypothetical protein C4542_03125 [Dehalococcoidia bacterium]
MAANWFQMIARVISIISFIILVMILAKKWLRKPIQSIGNFFFSLLEEDNNLCVFPYIRIINAYRAYFNDEALVFVTVFLPSSLIIKRQFKLKGTLTLSGHPSESPFIKTIEVNAQAVNRIDAWEFPISQDTLELIKTRVNEGKPFSAVLHLEDIDNTGIHWDTEEWTTLLLTKVN